jgi:ubiquinone/menaquinone biosynthesis C-methylase UbiE
MQGFGPLPGQALVLFLAIDPMMKFLLRLLRTVYYLLYHQFAWTYDLVAAVVSLGLWKDWVKTALPFIHGRVLEIGFGPGHLQVALGKKGLSVFGLDESRQMAKQAGGRLRKGDLPIRLMRGYAQNIPVRENSFDSVVATFPSEYIFDRRTLTEIHRVLVPDGNLVVIPTAWFTGRRLLDRLVAQVLRLTGQAPDLGGQLSAAIRERLGKAGFSVRTELVPVKSSRVLVVLANKTAFK